MISKTLLPPGFKMVNGWVWPEFDTDCSRVIFKMSRDLDAVLSWVPLDRRTNVVQAGGNCGVWPSILAGKFDQVYTAEPHPMNFAALVMNTLKHLNVTRLQAALGHTRKHLRLELAAHEQQNCGAFYVQDGGSIPTLRIDDLNLPVCGMIYLDIEGYELDALLGARSTIATCRPLIVIEDKGLSEKYGIGKGDCEKWLADEFDYVVLQRISKDVILGHRSQYPGAAGRM